MLPLVFFFNLESGKFFWPITKLNSKCTSHTIEANNEMNLKLCQNLCDTSCVGISYKFDNGYENQCLLCQSEVTVEILEDDAEYGYNFYKKPESKGF